MQQASAAARAIHAADARLPQPQASVGCAALSQRSIAKYEEHPMLTLSWCDGTRTSCMCDRTRSSVASSTALPAIAAAAGGTRSVPKACIPVAYACSMDSQILTLSRVPCPSTEHHAVNWRHAQSSGAAPMSIQIITDTCVIRRQTQRTMHNDSETCDGYLAVDGLEESCKSQGQTNWRVVRASLQAFVLSM